MHTAALGVVGVGERTREAPSLLPRDSGIGVININGPGSKAALVLWPDETAAGIARPGRFFRPHLGRNISAMMKGRMFFFFVDNIFRSRRRLRVSRVLVGSDSLGVWLPTNPRPIWEP